MFINYAHRGASAYAPENTMSAFRLGVALGANGIETDIRRTKDGVLVLFHDDNMFRLTGFHGSISELPYRQAAGFPVRSPDGSGFDRIPALAEFLDFAKEQRVFLALEIKEDDLETDLLRMIAACGLRERIVVTSFRLSHLIRIKALDPAQKVGLLTDTVNDDVILSLKSVCAEQICPKASALSPELVRALHEEGFNVRAWGISDEAKMKYACRCGVDGMTVNFPDKLRAYQDALKI